MSKYKLINPWTLEEIYTYDTFLEARVGERMWNYIDKIKYEIVEYDC